ncbi:MAG: UMP kinase [Bacteroidia bacterium]|nr:MAG: UMP kinase [Bacteroidia bacterium]
MKYNRILLKLSGEALAGKETHGISRDLLASYSIQIAGIANEGCQVSIVIGGGNIFRGIAGSNSGFDRVRGDQMGMLATVINSLALESELINKGVKARVYTSIRMEPVGRLYSRDKVAEDMESGIVCIIAGGTGNPYFTTDTAAALRAVEIGADILLKGTLVDGVYDSDPEKNPAAIKYDTLTFDEAISKQLKVMDLTAFTMCRENKLNLIVFDMNREGNLREIISGSARGTLVTN